MSLSIPATAATYVTSGIYPEIEVKISTQDTLAFESCAISATDAATQLKDIAQKVYLFFYNFYGLQGIDHQKKFPSFHIQWNRNSSAWTMTNGSSSESYPWDLTDANLFKTEFIAREYVEALIQNLRLLNANRDSRVIKNAVKDCFAIAFKQLHLGQTDWKIGDLRDISQFQTMAHFHMLPPQARTETGASLILSHAFYTATRQANKAAYEKVCQVWMQALLSSPPNVQINTFVYRTLSIAFDSFPTSTYQSVHSSWLHVGILHLAPPQYPLGTKQKK